MSGLAGNVFMKLKANIVCKTHCGQKEKKQWLRFISPAR